jgi:hypothetical protein
LDEVAARTDPTDVAIKTIKAQALFFSQLVSNRNIIDEITARSFGADYCQYRIDYFRYLSSLYSQVVQQENVEAQVSLYNNAFAISKYLSHFFLQDETQSSLNQSAAEASLNQSAAEASATSGQTQAESSLNQSAAEASATSGQTQALVRTSTDKTRASQIEELKRKLKSSEVKCDALQKRLSNKSSTEQDALKDSVKLLEVDVKDKVKALETKDKQLQKQDVLLKKLVSKLAEAKDKIKLKASEIDGLKSKIKAMGKNMAGASSTTTVASRKISSRVQTNDTLEELTDVASDPSGSLPSGANRLTGAYGENQPPPANTTSAPPPGNWPTRAYGGTQTNTIPPPGGNWGEQAQTGPPPGYRGEQTGQPPGRIRKEKKKVMFYNT